jgi:outer membrane protein assembly factor BamB
MRIRASVVAGAAVLALLAGISGAAPSSAPEALRYWGQWRGPLGNGEAPHAQPPVEWAEGKNVRWKIEVPGQGKSTPVIWKDLVIVTSATPSARDAATLEFVVLAYARRDGSLRWSRTVRAEQPHEGTHKDGSHVAGSAVTDGSRVYAFFGSRGLFALDMAGKVVWEKQLGQMRTRNAFGEGASPALHGGTLVVNWDHEGEDFIAAFDAASGREKWRRPREEPTTWTTPHVVSQGGRAQVVVGGTNRLRSYDLESGEPVWDAAGLTANVIPSPVSAGGVVYAMSGFRGNALRAVRLADAKGEVAGPPALAWTYDKDTPYVPSPLLYQGGLYFLKSNSGILTQLDAATGSPRFSERLEAVPNVYASPVAAAGRVYVVGRDGATAVVAATPQFKLLATNTLDDRFDASPALADDTLYLRGARHLYAIAEAPAKPARK